MKLLNLFFATIIALYYAVVKQFAKIFVKMQLFVNFEKINIIVLHILRICGIIIAYFKF